MITNAQVLDGTETHADYMAEIIAEAGIKSRLSSKFLAICKAELAGGNKHLNQSSAVTLGGRSEMALNRWDARGAAINSSALSIAFKKRGSYVTQAGLVSTIKNAVIIECA